MAIINCYDVNGDAIRFLTQWDHDISIRATGVKTSPIPEFRFSNKHSQKSKCISGVVVGDGAKATIPNGFLQEALPIYVQLFYTYPSGDAKTEHTFVIPVKPASMPDGAVYEPVEVRSIVELEKRVKALEENGVPGAGGIPSDPSFDTVRPAYVAQETAPEDHTVLWVDTGDHSRDESGQNVTLTTEQISALDGMFKVAAYDADSSYAAAYAAFRTAFGLTDSENPGEGDGGEETGVSNEITWTDGVAYTFEPIANEYPDKNTGVITSYNDWTRTPYLYCAGASTLRVTCTATTTTLNGGVTDNAFYDADKNYVSGFSYAGLASVEPGTYVDVQIPENAAYFILSGVKGRFPGSGGTTGETGCITLTPYNEVPV